MTTIATNDDVGGAHGVISNLLAHYADIADRKDIDAAVSLFAHARVRFPGGVGFDAGDTHTAHAFFTRLWSAPVGHRHDITTVRVTATADSWHAFAHYTRWLLDSPPLLHTLGEYELTVDPHATIT